MNVHMRCAESEAGLKCICVKYINSQQSHPFLKKVGSVQGAFFVLVSCKCDLNEISMAFKIPCTCAVHVVIIHSLE